MNEDKTQSDTEKAVIFVLKIVFGLIGIGVLLWILFMVVIGGAFFWSMYSNNWRVSFELDGVDMCTHYSSSMTDSGLTYPNECYADGTKYTDGGFLAYISLDDELILIGDDRSMSGFPITHSNSVVKVINKRTDTSKVLSDYNQLHDYLVNEKGIDADKVEIGNIFREIKRQGRKTKVKGLRSSVKLDDFIAHADAVINDGYGYPKEKGIKQTWAAISTDTAIHVKSAISIYGVDICWVNINESASEIRFCDAKKFSAAAITAYAEIGDHLHFFEGSAEHPIFLSYRLNSGKAKQYFTVEDFSKALKGINGSLNMDVVEIEWKPLFSLIDFSAAGAYMTSEAASIPSVRYEISQLGKKLGKSEVYSHKIGGFVMCFNKDDPFARFCDKPPDTPCKVTSNKNVVRNSTCDRNYNDADVKPLTWTMWAYAEIEGDYVFMYTEKDTNANIPFVRFFISNPWNSKENVNDFSTNTDITRFLLSKYRGSYSSLKWVVIADELEQNGILAKAIPDEKERKAFVGYSDHFVKMLNDNYERSKSERQKH